MQNVTSAFKRALAEDRRDYLLKAVITLADGTVLSESITTELPDGTEEVDTHAWLSNYSIWQNGFVVDDAVSADNVFQVGAAIINKATLILNNIYEDFDAYDFKDATVVLSVGLADLDNNTTEYVKKGTFVVDEATYNGSLITLSCLDYMAKFDKPYVTILTGPVTLGTIVSDMCTRVGVSLASNSSNFPHNDYLVAGLPSGESTTYRQVLSWAAQIAGCFARINVDGELELKWYDRTTLEAQASDLDGGTFDAGTPTYISGDTADGGSFNPWDTGAEIDGGSFTDVRPIHYITSSFSHNVSTDDVVITGVKVVKKVKTEGSSDAFYEYTYGTTGYMVVIENNDLIQGANGQNIADWLGAQLVGFTFRKADITHLSDPTIEAGDVALYWDRKGNVYSIVVSSTRFSAGSSQQTSSSAETPRKNSAAQFTESTRNYVEMRKQMRVQKDSVQEIMDDLADRIANASGLYVTEVVESGKTKLYYHDKSLLNESQIVMLFTTEGFTLTANYQDASPTWYGMTVNGQVIANMLATDGVVANWIRSGQLSVEDANHNRTFYANFADGTVEINASSLTIAGSAVSAIAKQEAQALIGDAGLTWYGNVVPTLSNYPASGWPSTASKDEHINDMYINKIGGGIYQFCVSNGRRIKFSEDSFTGTNGSLWVYFKDPTQTHIWYEFSPGLGGHLNGKEIFIPSGEYVLQYNYQNASSSGEVYYAPWEVVSEELAYGTFPTGVIATGDPRLIYPNDPLINCDTYPAFPHEDYDPSSGQRVMFYRSVGLSSEYIWDKVSVTEDVKSQMSMETVFNLLTNNGTARGLYMDGNQLYLLFDYAQGGTLKLGGPNNGRGLLQVYDTSDAVRARIDASGIAYTSADGYQIKWEGAHLHINHVSSYTTKLGDITGALANESETGYNELEITAPYALFLSAGSSGTNLKIYGQRVDISNNLYVANVYTQGTKSRLVENTEYGNRLLYSYETPTPYFGDIGTGQTDENGEAVIAIDDIFDETVNTNIEYCVFLQKEGQGDLWVDEKDRSFFTVKGTPNLKFSWEIKAVQKGFENLRLDDDTLRQEGEVPTDELEQLLAVELAEYDKEMEELYQ